MVSAVFERGLEVLIPTLLLLLALAVVGGTTRIALRYFVAIPAGIGLAGGLGLAVVSITIVWGHFIGIPVTPLAVALTAVGVLALLIWNRQRIRSPRTALTAMWRDREWRASAGVDVGAFLFSGIALAPLMRVGATFWTAWANDFPSYVGYAQVWLLPRSGTDAYLTRHPDAFGDYMAFNAQLDHPAVTGWLTFAQTLTHVPVAHLLTPLVWTLLFITISAAAQLIRRLFGFGAVPALCLAVIPGLSVIPFTRMLDNQLGQGMLIAELMVLLAILPSIDRESRRSSMVALAVGTGALAAAAIGANYAALLAFAPVMLMLALGILHARGITVRRSLAVCALLAVTALVLVIPLIPGWLESLARNLSGTIGQHMSFPTALASIGLQVAVDEAPTFAIALLTWVAAIVIAVVLILTSGLTVRDRYLACIAIAIAMVNLIAIVLRVGPDNYGTQKWMALFIALVMPIALAAGAMRLHAVDRLIGRMTLGILTATTLLIAISASSRVPFVVPRDLMSLGGDPILSRLEHVNIDLGNYYEDAIAAAVLPSKSMTVIRDTYAVPSPATGVWTLVRRDAAGPWQATLPLNDTYMLASPIESAQPQ